MLKSDFKVRPLPSFGGGVLVGEKLVRLTYIDEAGLSNPKQEPFLVVAGVIVEADRRLKELREALNGIIECYVPTEFQHGFIFHATELFHGGKQINRDDLRWPMSLRMEIAKELARLPALMELPIIFGWVQRNNCQESTFEPNEIVSGHDRQIDQHAIAYMRCIFRVDQWMRHNTENEITMMIVEDNDVAKRSMRDAQVYYQDKSLPGLTEDERPYLPLKTIEEDPLFQPKRTSSVLQLSDFCAYIFKRTLMNPRNNFYRQFWEQIEPWAEYFKKNDD